MGTRADFYVGVGEGAEWLGSVAWDGYQWAESPDGGLMATRSVEEWRQVVSRLLERDDACTPALGWPWPWNDSTGTDYAYAWHNGKPLAVQWGEGYEWPDMSGVREVAFDGRSGLTLTTSDGNLPSEVEHASTRLDRAMAAKRNYERELDYAGWGDPHYCTRMDALLREIRAARKALTAALYEAQ